MEPSEPRPSRISLYQSFTPTCSKIWPLPNKKVHAIKLKDAGYRVDLNSLEVFDRSLFKLNFESADAVFDEDKKQKISLGGSTNGSNEDKSVSSDYFMVNLLPWEANIAWDDDEINSKALIFAVGAINSTDSSDSPSFRVPNELLDSGDWLNNVVWDDASAEKLARLGTVNHETPLRKAFGQKAEFSALTNDKLYDRARLMVRVGRIRQSHSALSLQHSLPALRLLLLYFPADHSIAHLRMWHRMPVYVAPKIRHVFSKTKRVKKMKKVDFKTGKPRSSPFPLEFARELTLKDNSKYVLLEYSEEFPPILSNVGMATLIMNYYRKLKPSDPYIPKLPIGEAVLLENVDASPFLGFGEVMPGQTFQAISNHLLKAPIFEHKPNANDFLVIKNTTFGSAANSSNGSLATSTSATPSLGGAKTKFYLREVEHMFTVGQILPLQEVMQPGNRRNSYARKRLSVEFYRLLRKQGAAACAGRVQYKDIKQAFPFIPDSALKLRLKELCRHLNRPDKNGDKSLVYMMKMGARMPTEHELFRSVTAEMPCLYEAGLAGRQRILDAAYAPSGERSQVINLEEACAPWVLTRNFLEAVKGKAVLELQGPGDPTGCGEGISFIRKTTSVAEDSSTGKRRYGISSLKDLNYKETIMKIWNLQARSLSSSNSPPLSKPVPQPQTLSKPFNKVMVISRRHHGVTGTKAVEVETVDDPQVISAYVKMRRFIEAASKRQRGRSMSAGPGTDGDKAADPASNARTAAEMQRRILLKTKEVITQLKLSDYRRSYMKVGSSTFTAANGLQMIRLKTRGLRRRGQGAARGGRGGGRGGAIGRPRGGAVKKGAREKKKRKAEELGDTINSADASRRSSLLFLSTPSGAPLGSGHTSERQRKAHTPVEFATLLEHILQEAMKIPGAVFFKERVSTKIAPRYYEIIKRPMWTDKVRQNAKRFAYKKVSEFLADVDQIAENSKTYNGPDHEVTVYASQLVKKIVELVEQFREVILQLEQDMASESLQVSARPIPSIPEGPKPPSPTNDRLVSQSAENIKEAEANFPVDALHRESATTSANDTNASEDVMDIV